MAGTLQAFAIGARPAMDSVEAALDRVKMNMNLKFADWGLPCPITGEPGAMAQPAAFGGQRQLVRAALLDWGERA
ncbi:hypothetical protein CHLRE_12g526500v5 [Chlamydomonas reinhardtii]|uniref:Uncharacterized protein n=1 Tax=Chlamydomonas reinhardtii TaxID=3055 RepID=A0A2K3D4E9_CHLRE|nr:uncharacterized protein CHLRE_12g526071v5 [Chlamydomonas reinhardtii]XP_042918578.1 uncharacterized protein CHLRE_12g526500v5 [Chlamydomonas reinhardtii]PNW75414.1 hypothetical protein CHLRE_12g526071v5 [Chlamydomonas reinhardtii]PNW75427.1 hypothetical protein CHLRE_12g526500v5 [Chlamydomonas reinhardtii]